jgi:hypothetical protein
LHIIYTDKKEILPEVKLFRSIPLDQGTERLLSIHFRTAAAIGKSHSQNRLLVNLPGGVKHILHRRPDILFLSAKDGAHGSDFILHLMVLQALKDFINNIGVIISP